MLTDPVGQEWIGRKDHTRLDIVGEQSKMLECGLFGENLKHNFSSGPNVNRIWSSSLNEFIEFRCNISGCTL
jgi:hypothetical protein